MDTSLVYIFKMRIKGDLLCIFIGNVIAEVIMLTVSIHIAEGSSIELLLIAILAISIGIYTMNKKKR